MQLTGDNPHAGVCVQAYKVMKLNGLCRYSCRPPVAAERLSVLKEIGLDIFPNSVCQVQRIRAGDKIENSRGCYEAAEK
jgi:hypothetical protein